MSNGKILSSQWALLTLLSSCATQTNISLSKKEMLKDTAEAKTPISSVAFAQPPTAPLGFGYTGPYFKETPIYSLAPLSSIYQSILNSVVSSSNVLITAYVTELELKEIVEKFKGERVYCRTQIEFTVESRVYKVTAEYTSPSSLTDATDKLAETLRTCIQIAGKTFLKQLKIN